MKLDISAEVAANTAAISVQTLSSGKLVSDSIALSFSTDFVPISSVARLDCSSKIRRRSLMRR